MSKRSILAGLALSLCAFAAQAQAPFQTLPPNTVIGRVGVGQFGPPAAIPFSTLVANLGLGAPAHSILLGTGTTGTSYGIVAPSSAGQVLIDQGAGVDPAFKPVSGSCTLAASGAMSCSGVGAGVTAINSSTTPTYTALTTDCLKTIAVTGGVQETITVNAASTYGACAIDIMNANSWASPAGVVLNISGLTTAPPVLYPGMTITLLNVSNSWVQKPGVSISRSPVGTRLYVDGVNGSDANDCLKTTTACQTLQHVVMEVIFSYLEAAPGSATGSNAGFDIRLIDDPACAPSTGVNCIHGLHMSGLPRRSEGHNSIMIECDDGTAANCTIADNTGGQAIGMYCACFLELKNVTLAGGSSGNNAIQVEKGMVRVEGGVVIGNTGSLAQLSALDGGTIVLEGGTTTSFSSGGNYLAQVSAGGNIQLDQATIVWTGDAAYAQTLAANNGTISATSTTWTVGAFTVTATYKLSCSPGGFIVTGGTAASVPGTTTQVGCALSSSGQYN